MEFNNKDNTETIAPIYPETDPSVNLENIRLDDTTPLNENDVNTDETKAEDNTDPNNKGVIDDFKKNLGLKIHLAVGSVIVLIVMIVWQMIEKPPHWFFVHPAALVAFTLSIHYNILKKTPFNIMYSLIIIANVDCILTWASHDPRIDPFPIFVLMCSLMLYYLIRYFRKPKEERNLFKFLVKEYVILSSFLFLIWAFYGNPHFPWFIIPSTILSIPLIMYYVRCIKGYKDKLTIFVIINTLLVFLMFMMWFFTKIALLIWFLLPLSVSMIILLLLQIRKSKNTDTEKVESEIYETV